MAKRNQPVFGRVLTAAVTPFTKGGALDRDGLKRLLKYIQPQCDGVVVGGSTGEGPTLSAKEKLELVAFYKEHAKRGFKVLANVGTNDTAESVRLARAAAKAGADGLMVVGPYYNKPNVTGQLAHFTKVGEATDLPVLLYNIPGRTGLRVAHDVIVELAATDCIQAVKDATADLEAVARLRSQTASNFYIYSGDDTLTLAFLALGGSGVVSVASHLIGREIGEMIAAFVAGDHGEALDIQLHYLELMRELFMTTNPIPVKAALARLGVIEPHCRLPLTLLDEECEGRLEAVLREYEFIS
ncbi:4-hydroxy-tetrahydrodipicolinate synthase [bacterium]|nr:4-hydroxy-tetrahydrodipicolinate synthase [bacterium]